MFKNIKYPVSDKDFVKTVIRPIERLRNIVAAGDLEMTIFSDPVYNRYFKYLGKHVNYARANIHNTRILASEDENTENNLEGDRLLEQESSDMSPMSVTPVTSKKMKESLITGNEQFDRDLQDIGKMQKEITRRLTKLMEIRRKRRKLNLQVRFEVKPTVNYELTKDLTSGGLEKIDLNIEEIIKKNPYHEIARSFAMQKKLAKMDDVQSDFVKRGGLVGAFTLVQVLLTVCLWAWFN